MAAHTGADPGTSRPEAEAGRERTPGRAKAPRPFARAHRTSPRPRPYDRGGTWCRPAVADGRNPTPEGS
ncbi:hypothetical protein GCM10010249_13350 [Streptomyces roseolilacinus]|uniref:Uncharacterized protein n=1 Tax=Streptomyces roseolilacinus TaxID=66904 RepID=A0A918AZM1_9ACTN|nr:hypothetical protein GCM10010249_13350 [Streptomyces roseolilacinus]